MNILNRRQFLLLSVGLAAGCASAGKTGNAKLNSEVTVIAGKPGDYIVDGVYSRFADQGFFLVRKAGQFFALSAICTHRKCKLTDQPDHSFYCECHGSIFSPTGHVLEGPAQRDLPEFPVSLDTNGELVVKLHSV